MFWGKWTAGGAKKATQKKNKKEEKNRNRRKKRETILDKGNPAAGAHFVYIGRINKFKEGLRGKNEPYSKH